MFTTNAKATPLFGFFSSVPSDYDYINIVKFIKGYDMIHPNGDTWKVYYMILSIVYMHQKISASTLGHHWHIGKNVE